MKKRIAGAGSRKERGCRPADKGQKRALRAPLWGLAERAFAPAGQPKGNSSLLIILLTTVSSLSV